MQFPIDLQLIRSINDSVHGSIRLSNDEMSIIENPLFRRLHNIRQNSFLYNVFPTAKHTRFEHSIGVMHCAHQMLTAVIENGRIASERRDIANEAEFAASSEKGIGIDLFEHLKNNEELLKSIFFDVRIAALLHDIGHGPLSHLFDSYAPSQDEFLQIMNTDPVVNQDTYYLTQIEQLLINHTKKQIEAGNKDIRIEHEHVSSYFTYKILGSLGYDTSRIHRILTILKPELELDIFSVNVYDKEFNLSQLLTDIVAGAPIDCDRMDYLKRDSASAGVPYGNYSEDRVLKTLLPYVHNKKVRMGLKISGLHAIESVLIARYQMYVQVYGHKTNEACNAMLNYIGKGERLSFIEWTERPLTSENFESLYIGLSDEGFLNLLKNKLSEKKLIEKQNTIEKLQSRDLWKRVYEVEEYVANKRKPTEVQSIFLKQFEIMNDLYPNSVEKYVGDRFPLKDLGLTGARLLEKKSQSHYVISEKELKNSSQIIESLNKGLRILRIYALNPDKVNEYKQYARIEIHPEIVMAETKN